MGKIKVGIYVFTHQIKDRKLTIKDMYFDGKAYYGFNSIIEEIDKKRYDITHVSSCNFNDVDFVLLSITSYYDIFNIRSELKGKQIKAKFIIGGAGISNHVPLEDIAHVIVIGRGEGLINELLDGGYVDRIIHQPKKTISINGYSENSIGCPMKCKFCQYGWKFTLYPDVKNYNSGYNNREDLIQNLDFSICNRRTAPRLNSAIDGFTQSTRDLINKKITNENIIEKFKEIYEQKQSYFALKLYAIVGFPWENNIQINEFIECVKKADKKSEKKLNVFLISTHFCPMPFTPMESLPVNTHDFRKECEKSQTKVTYKGKSINVYYPYSQISSPISAIEQTIINRIKTEQLPIFDKVLLSSKYRSLNGIMKQKVIDKHFPGIYDYFEDVCPDVERPYKYKKMRYGY